MDIIRTKEDWWNVLEKHWANIENLIFTYHPSEGHRHGMKITAEGAERACESVRRLIATETKTECLEDRVKRCRSTNSEDMAIILEETWFGIPESTESRCLPSFGAFCDLCSERWVFEDVDEKYLDKEE